MVMGIRKINCVLAFGSLCLASFCKDIAPKPGAGDVPKHSKHGPIRHVEAASIVTSDSTVARQLFIDSLAASLTGTEMVEGMENLTKEEKTALREAYFTIHPERETASTPAAQDMQEPTKP